MPTDAPAPTLADTIRAFENGITNLSTDAAIELLDAWTDRINETGRKDLEGIARMLQQVSGLLQNTPHQGVQIGDYLKRIGAHTAEIASGESGERAEQLRKLAGLCTAAGKALAGGDRTRETPPYASYDTGDQAADNLQSQNKADDLAQNR